MDFVLVSPGAFVMGSETGESDERPAREVTISRPFYMGVCEVKQKQWEALMGSNPSYSWGDDLPVERVSWHDCQRFLARLQEKVGQGMICRLPTEAEWEYACRAGTRTRYCFGDDENALEKYAWFTGNSGGRAHNVGGKKPNAWGLYDMHGNAWEWCADWYEANYYAGGPTHDPAGPVLGDARVSRGGSWYYDAKAVRSPFRFKCHPAAQLMDLGFRVVISRKAPEVGAPAAKEEKTPEVPKTRSVTGEMKGEIRKPDTAKPR